jgi:hemerythrin-like metal-binding protein
MTAITWGPQLETGIGIVDKQHKHWVDLFNALAASTEGDRKEEAILETLDALLDYSHSHFRTEEALMTRASYEGLEEHRAAHKVFTDQIQIFRDRVELHEWTLSLEVLEYMRGWLVEHVTATDREYVPVLNAAGVA